MSEPEQSKSITVADICGAYDRRIVPHSGPPTAPLAIFGEAPGKDEEIKGIPFIGYSGQLLDRLLYSAGLHRHEIYVDNIIPIRPPSNNLNRLKDLGLTQEQFYEGARQRLLMSGAKVCVLLGGTALKCFTGLDSITKHRGSVYNWNGILLVPSIHPAAILRGQGVFGYMLEFDLRRAKQLLDHPELITDQSFDMVISPTKQQVIEELARLEKSPVVTCDVETTGKYIDCIGFGDSVRTICVPFITREGNYWSSYEDESIVWNAVQSLLASNALKVFHNAMYELFHFSFYGLEVRNFWLDTMLAIHCLYPEFPKALYFVQSIYTYLPYHKDEGRDADSDEDRWIYNCKDVIATHWSASGLVNDLISAGLAHFFFNHQMELVRPYLKCSIAGMDIDYSKLSQFRLEAENKLVRLQEELNTTVKKTLRKLIDNGRDLTPTTKILKGGNLNVKSSKQVKHYLYDLLNLKPISKHGKTTTSEDALWLLTAKYPHITELKLIIKIRNCRTYIENFLTAKFDADRKNRPGYNIAATVTGRSSSSSNPHWSSISIHTPPRKPSRYREIFIPSEGKVFVEADLSQAEARIVAALSHDVEELRMHEKGENVHIRNASVCTGLPTEQCQKGTQAYNLGKTSKHAFHYDVGPVQLYRQIVRDCGRAETPLPDGFNVAMCKQIIARLEQYSPQVRHYQAVIKRDVSKTRKLVNPFGRRRIFMGTYSPELFRSAYSTLPQSTVVDIIHRAMKLIDHKEGFVLPEGANLVAQIHDALIAECWEKDAEATGLVLKAAMEVPIYIDNYRLVIPTELKTGVNFYEL